MTTILEDPGSYGRIVRDDRGELERIVEAKEPGDATAEELAIKEINTGTYAFAAAALADALARIGNDNAQSEYYLGDVLPLMRAEGLKVAAHLAADEAVTLGVNNRADLAARGSGGQVADPRAPHARRGHGRRPGLDLGRRRRRDRRRRPARARHLAPGPHRGRQPAPSSAPTRP